MKDSKRVEEALCQALDDAEAWIATSEWTRLRYTQADINRIRMALGDVMAGENVQAYFKSAYGHDYWARLDGIHRHSMSFGVADSGSFITFLFENDLTPEEEESRIQTNQEILMSNPAYLLKFHQIVDADYEHDPEKIAQQLELGVLLPNTQVNRLKQYITGRPTYRAAWRNDLEQELDITTMPDSILESHKRYRRFRGEGRTIFAEQPIDHRVRGGRKYPKWRGDTHLGYTRI